MMSATSKRQLLAFVFLLQKMTTTFIFYLNHFNSSKVSKQSTRIKRILTYSSIILNKTFIKIFFLKIFSTSNIYIYFCFLPASISCMCYLQVRFCELYLFFIIEIRVKKKDRSETAKCVAYV